MTQSIATVATAIFMTATLLASCSTSDKKSADNYDDPFAEAPVFNSDSAFSYVRQQVEFGPRVPGTPAHDKCADYLAAELRRHGATEVIEQKTNVRVYTGQTLPCRNIFARFNTDATDRVLLLAHYDTRPWADQDDNKENAEKPIPGANDGGSGVAVILEIARNINKLNKKTGIDILFVDVEDYGKSAGWDNNNDTWGLGTQYFVKNLPYTADNLPRWGICLDMVGGKNAVFHREFISNTKAKDVVDLVWNVAVRSGYGERFINEAAGSIIDDHYFINNAGIKCIDIIECNSNTTRSFPETWHTLDDDLNSIDPQSLKAAGQTVINTIYQLHAD